MRQVITSRRGFTVLELFITVTIIIIIVFTVVPSFWRSQQRAIGAKALDNLDHIRTAQIMYHAEEQTFTSTAADLQPYVPFVLTDSEWSYQIGPGADGDQFVAVATRANGRPFAGFTITLTVDTALLALGQSSRIDYSAGTSYPP